MQSLMLKDMMAIQLAGNPYIGPKKAGICIGTPEEQFVRRLMEKQVTTDLARGSVESIACS